MKPSSIRTAAIRAFFAATLMTISTAGWAQNLYWDIDGPVAGSGGATPSGTWDGSAANWNANSSGTGSATVWGAGSNAVFSAGTDASGNFTVTMSGTQTAGGIIFKDGTVTLSGDPLALNAAAQVYVYPGKMATIASVITGTTWSKTGVGALTLSEANTFSSTLSLITGRLRVNNNSAIGTGSIAVSPSGDALLQNAGTDVTIGNAILVNSGGTSFDVSSAGGTLTLNGNISGSRTLWTVGNDATNTVVFGGNNSFGGNLQIKSGTLTVTHDSALGTTGGNTEVASGASLGFKDGVYYNSGENVKVSGNGVSGLGAIRSFTGINTFFGTLDLQTSISIGADANSQIELAGQITGSSYDLTKVGAGTLKISGLANNYRNTEVATGALQVESSLGSGPVTVDSNGLLFGNGNLGVVGLSGTISPGTGIGTLNSGSETWNAGSTNFWEINESTTYGSPGSDPGWDLLAITGSLDVSAGPITIAINSLDFFTGWPGDASDFDPTVQTDFTIATTATGITGFTASNFILNDSAFSNNKDGGRFVILQNGNNLVLRFDPKPVITAGNLTQNNDPNSCGANVSFAASVTDNQPGVTVVYSTNGVPIVTNAENTTASWYFPVGNTVVDAVATDSVGNTNTTSFLITVLDAQPPNAIAQSVSQSLDGSGSATVTAAQVNNGSYDNCSGISSVQISKNGTTGWAASLTYSCSDVGSQSVYLKVTDTAGNSAINGTASVTISDTTAPVAQTKNIDVNLSASNPGTITVTATGIDNGSSDNCSIAQYEISKDGVSFSPFVAYDCSETGPQTAFLKVVDSAGLSATNPATVTVHDVTLPVAVAQNVSKTLDASGNATVLATEVNNGSSDNCSVTNWLISTSASGPWAASLGIDCSNVGTNTVYLQVADASGNLSVPVSAEMIISDLTAPVVACSPINITLESDGTYALTAADVSSLVTSATDACGIATTNVSPDSFTFCDVAASPIPVTVTVTDIHGNATNVTSSVAVSAPSAPAVVYVDPTYTGCGPVTFPNSAATGAYYVGYNAFTNIQSAVAAVGFGGIIHVANGNYTLTTSLYITKSLTLAGESQAGVTIDASACGTSWGIFVSTNNCSLSNFTVLPPISLPNNGGYAIHASPAEPLTVASPKILNLTLANITAANGHRTPFDLHGVDGGLLDGLTATGFIRGNGIQLTACDNIAVRNCTTSGNAWGGLAIYTSTYLQSGSSNISIEPSCTFNETPAIYEQPVAPQTITGVSLGDPYYTVDFGGGNLSYCNTESDALTLAAGALYAGYPSTITAPDTNPVPFYAGKDLVQVDDDWSALTAGTPVFVGGTNFTFGFNAFATISGGVSAVNANGTVNTLAGSYEELVSITKTLSLTSDAALGAHLQAPASANNAALITVDASNVSIIGFDLLVNQPDATAGIYMDSIGADPDTNLAVKDCRLKISGAFTAHAADAYIGFDTSSTAIAVNGNGGFPSIQLLNNEILPDSITAPTAMFDRAIFLREGNGIIAGNTVYGDAHDLAAQFISNGALTVTNNQFLGKGGRDTKGAQVDFTEPNATGSILLAHNTIIPFEPATPSGSTHVRSVMIKNNASGAAIVIDGNQFTDVEEVAILSGNSKNTVIENNSFTPKAGDSSFVHVQISNKVPTTGTPAPVEMNATIQGNTFGDSTVPGGRAIEFLNHNTNGATFGTITIGGAGVLANTFAPALERFISLDNEVQADSKNSARPNYGQYGSTAMGPFTANLYTTANLYDVGAGPESPAAMTPASLFALENKIFHAPDNSALGLVRVKADNVYVTTASGSIQRGINAATAGDTVNVNYGTFSENLALNKRIILNGQGSGSNPAMDTIVASATANTPVINITASGSSAVDRLVVQNLRVTGATGTGNAGTGIEFITAPGSYYTFDNVASVGNGGNGMAVNFNGNATDMMITGCSFLNNGEAGFRLPTAGGLDGLTVTDSHFDGNVYGFEVYMGNGSGSIFQNVNVSNSTFDNNSSKGIYAEKLNNATFSSISVSNSGYAGSFGAGININLKYNAYSNIQISNSDIIACGTGDSINGGGVVIEARGTGSDSGYSSNPATLSGVALLGLNVTNCPDGIRFGEPGKNNTGPTGVSVQNCNLASNLHDGIRNESSSLTDAASNWWGSVTGPSSAAINPYGTGVEVAGSVAVNPWLSNGTDLQPDVLGFQPDLGVNYQPAHLAFTTQPVGAALGSPLSQQPVVQVQDVNNNLTPWANPTVTVALGSNPGLGVLTGTTTVAASSGAATNTDLAVTVGGGSGFTLVASAPDLSSATSAAFDIGNPAPSIVSLNPAGAVTGSGSGSASVIITGANFVPTSEVLVDGTPVTTSFNSATQLTAMLSTASAGSYAVTVTNPGAGPIAGPLTFTVGNQPAVVYVDANYAPGNTGTNSWGYDAFNTIAGGLAAVASGGTVNVAAGTYSENVVVSQAVTLLGANNGASGCSHVLPESIINGAAGTGIAVDIASDGVTVDGFNLTGKTGVRDAGHQSVSIINNLVTTTDVGAQLQAVAPTAVNGITVATNCFNLTGQIGTTGPSVGVAVVGVTGSKAPVIHDNNVTGAFYGYFIYGAAAAEPTTITGGTISGAMQGVAVINSGPAPFGTPAPSIFAVDGVSMSGFAGDYSSMPPMTNINFHAGVYVYTGGTGTLAAVTGTVTNVTVAGTGNIEAECAGLDFADFSTDSGVRQSISVQNCTIQNNLNRGINVRGTNAVVSITGSTLMGNGSNPFTDRGNAGFGIAAANSAQVTVNQCFISNPTSQTASTATAIAAFVSGTWTDGPKVTVSDCSIQNNGNANGYLTAGDAGTLNASGNWWGTTDDATINALITGSVDFTPYLASGTDTDGGTSGFQGDFSSLYVTALGAQTGATGRVQEGINTTTSGGTALVNDGTFTESIVVSQPLTLASVNGPGTTTLVGTGAGDAIKIDADNVTIRGFTVKNPAVRMGIYAKDHSHLLITENLLADIGLTDATVQPGYGIAIESSQAAVDDVQIVGNTISNLVCVQSANAIVAGFTPGTKDITGLIIASNRITQITSTTKGAYGIQLNHTHAVGGGVTSDAQIFDNEISGLNGAWAHAIGLEGNTPNAFVSGNSIHDLTAAGSDAVGVQVEDNASASSITIASNSFASLVYGVQNVTAYTVAAAGNWWASASGPANSLNPGATGVGVTANVVFSPWLGDGTDTSADVGFQPNPSPVYYQPDHLVFGTEPVGAGINSPFTVQPVVEVRDANNGLATEFNGSVTVAINTGTPGAALTGTLTLPVSSGVASFAGLQLDKAGSYTLSTTSASPITATISTSFEIAQTTNAIALGSSLNPSTYGDLVTFTAAIQTNGVTAGDATGTITFSVDGNPAWTNALVGGVTTYATTNLMATSHAIVATYSGDINYTNNAPSPTLTQIVDQKLLDITANSTNKIYGETLTFVGTEFTTGAGQLIGSDAVSSVTLTSAGAAPAASASGSPYNIIPSAAVGTGLGNYSIMYHTGLLTVGQAASSWAYGGSQFIYNSAAQSPGIILSGSTGAVTTNYVGTNFDGTAYESVNAPTNAGVYYVSNTVAADDNYFGATSNSVFTIAQATNAIALSSSLNASTYGDSVIFTAAVQTNGVTAGDATSNIVFSVDGVPTVTNALVNGGATFTNNAFAVADHYIVATYTGDNNYTNNAVSPILTQTVNPATPTLTINSATPVNYGQMLNVSTISGTATNSHNGSPVTGTFSFTSPGIVPTVTAPQAVTFTPDDATDYTVASGSVSVTVIDPVILTQPMNVTQVLGGNVSFSVTAIGTSPLHYQWQQNTVDLPGQTASNLVLNAIADSAAGNYRVIVTNLAGLTISSNATLVITHPPVFTQQPVSLVVNQGQQAQFTVNVNGTSPFTYQWFKGAAPLSNGGNILGATSKTLIINSTTGSDDGSYSVYVANADGTNTSLSASLTVIVPPAITFQPLSITNDADTTAIFVVTNTGSPSVYRWYKNGPHCWPTAATSTVPPRRC